VSYLGLCFCLLFTAFSTSRSYLTTVFPTYGYWSFFMMYIGFMVGSMSAVPMLHRSSPRVVMFGASLTYVVFLSLINTGNVPLFLITSTTMGMGAGSIWVAQAMYLMRTSSLGPVQLGRLTAVFFAFWSLSSFFGSSLAILAIRLGLVASGVFWIMTGVCIASSILFFFVRNVELIKPVVPLSPFDVVRQTLALVPHMPAHLIIYGMNQGFSLLLIWAVLPTLVSPELDKISVVIVAYSISATSSSYAWGYLHDRKGMFTMLLCHFVNGLAGLASIIAITASHAPWYVFVVSGLLCGSFDQCNNNLITTLVKHCLPTNIEKGVSVYRLSFAVTVVLFSTVALYAPYLVFLALCVLTLSLGFTLFVRDHLRTRTRRRNALPPADTLAEEEECIPGADSPVRSASNPLVATHSALALIAQQAAQTLLEETGESVMAASNEAGETLGQAESGALATDEAIALNPLQAAATSADRVAEARPVDHSTHIAALHPHTAGGLSPGSRQETSSSPSLDTQLSENDAFVHVGGTPASSAARSCTPELAASENSSDSDVVRLQVHAGSSETAEATVRDASDHAEEDEEEEDWVPLISK
jgi:hypothetical protein